DRRVQVRNRYLMMLKNDSLASFARDLPRIAAYEVLALGYALLRERHLLRGYGEALRLAPEARRKGRAIAQARRVDPRPAPFAPGPRPRSAAPLRRRSPRMCPLPPRRDRRSAPVGRAAAPAPPEPSQLFALPIE